MDLDETLVAHAFATSSIEFISIYPTGLQRIPLSLLTCTIVEGIEHGKESADDKDIGILVELHLDRRPVGRYQLKMDTTGY